MRARAVSATPTCMAATPSCPRLHTSPSDETATVRGVPRAIVRIPVAGSRLGRAAVSIADTSSSRAPSRSTCSASAASCEPSSRSAPSSPTARATHSSPARNAPRRRPSSLTMAARPCTRMSTGPQCRPTSRQKSACSTAERPLPPSASGSTSPNQPIAAKSARRSALSAGEAPVPWSRSSGIARDRNLAAVSAISISEPSGARNMMLSTRLDPGRQSLPTAHRRRARHLGLFVIDFPLGPTRQYLLEGNPALKTSETRAETEMDAVAEAQVIDVLAFHVETIGILELALVPVRRTVEQQQRGPLGHPRPVQLDVPRDVAGLHRRRRLVAKDLLDGVRNEAAVGGEESSLVGESIEQVGRPADQPGRRLVPGPCQQSDVAQELVVAQRPLVAVVVDEAGIQQLGHQVV